MLTRILNAEPVVFTAFLAALATFLVSLGFVTQAHADTVISILTPAISFALPLIAGYFARSRVDSPNTVAAKVAAAATTPPAP